MPEQEIAPKKEGVHGWRAFLLIFGCGTVAALLVFGSIIGVGRIIGSSFTSSSPSEGEDSEIESSREPRESVPPELLDLCELIELENLIGAAQGNRTDEKDDYVDTATEDGSDPRIVSDSCSWGVVGSEGRNWDFEITYIAHMEDSDSHSMADAANDSFDEFVESIDDGNSSNEGKLERLEGQSRYFYADSNEGEDVYDLVRLNGSGAYHIRLKGNDVAEKGFRTEIVKAAPYLDGALERHTPD